MDMRIEDLGTSSAPDVASGGILHSLRPVDALFADARRQLEERPETAPECRPLGSLIKHREGLSACSSTTP